MRKNYLLIAAAAIFLSQAQEMTAQSRTCAIDYYEGDGWMMSTRISDNGKYVSGIEYPNVGYLLNTVTEERTLIPISPDAVIKDPTTLVWDVANDGTTVGITYKDTPGYYRYGECFFLEVEKGTSMGDATSITPDGEMIVGWAKVKKKLPCFWRGVDWKDIKQTMLDVPTLDNLGDPIQSASADRVSADGSVIVGNYRSGVGTYCIGLLWKWNASENKYKYEELFKDSLETNEPTPGRWVNYTITEVSPNGKWIAGMYGIRVDGGGEDGEQVHPFVYRYNLETAQIDFINDVEVDPGIGDGGPSAIDNNGTVYSSTVPASSPWARTASISEVGKPSVALESYLADECNYSEFGERLAFSGTVMGVTPDGLTLVGHGASMDADQQFDYFTYIIKLDGGSPVGISGTESAPAFGCRAEGNILHLTGTLSSLEIVDMAGSVVYKSNVNGSSVSLAGLSEGIYVVKLSDGKEVRVQKITVAAR